MCYRLFTSKTPPEPPDVICLHRCPLASTAALGLSKPSSLSAAVILYLRHSFAVRLKPMPCSFHVVIFDSFRIDMISAAGALPQIPSAVLWITDHYMSVCWRTILSQFNKHSGSKARFSWNTIKSAGMAKFGMLELAFLIASTVVCPSS